jgi:hypothetical protein
MQVSKNEGLTTRYQQDYQNECFFSTSLLRSKHQALHSFWKQVVINFWGKITRA